MVKITQDSKDPVAVEVIADAIVQISNGVKKLRSGRLNDKALILLIREASPMCGAKYRKKNISSVQVRVVLEGIESLSREFIRTKPTA